MKLSKKNAARQRALQKAIASGKALGGMLVGFAASVVGCGERHSPAHTMGRFPDPSYREGKSTNENADGFVTSGDIAEPMPKKPQPKPNVVNEVKEERRPRLQGAPLPPTPPKPPATQRR